MRTEKIILLCRNTTSSLIVYNYLSQFYAVSKVIIEDAPSKWSVLKKRGKNLGWAKVFGQLLFQVIIVFFLKIKSKKRISDILIRNGLSTQPIPGSKIIHVTSANADKTIDELKVSDENVIIVNGTRILSKKLLDIPNKIFINMHAGITPAYRGVHGAYWAFRNNEPHLSGVTIHYIDKGIDTGEVISQKIIEKERADNFVTFPFLQIAEGLPELNNVIKSIGNGELKYIKPFTNRSKLYSHPTIIEYLKTYFTRGLK